MGEHEGVNPSYLLLPEKGGDHILSNVKPILIKTASIDEHLLPLRKFYKDGISLSHIDKRQSEVFLERIFQIPKYQIQNENDAKPCKEILDLLPFSEVNHQEQEKVKKDDFKRSGCGNKEGCVRNGGKKGQHFEQDEGDEPVDVDQEGSEGGEEEREDGSGKAQGDDQEAHPGDDEEVCEKSNGGETIEVECDKRGGSQNSDSRDKKRDGNIFQKILFPRGFKKNGNSLFFKLLKESWH